MLYTRPLSALMLKSLIPFCLKLGKGLELGLGLGPGPGLGRTRARAGWDWGRAELVLTGNTLQLGELASKYLPNQSQNLNQPLQTRHDFHRIPQTVYFYPRDISSSLHTI